MNRPVEWKVVQHRRNPDNQGAAERTALHNIGEDRHRCRTFGGQLDRTSPVFSFEFVQLKVEQDPGGPDDDNVFRR